MARSRLRTPPQRSSVFIMSQGSPRVQPWTAYCQLLCIHTLTKSAFVTPLSSTLTRPSRKNIKRRDFNSFRIRSYSTPSRKSLIRNNLTKYGGRGEGGLFGSEPEPRVTDHGSRHRVSPLHLQPPLPPLPRPVTTHQSPITSHRHVRLCSYETAKPDYRGNSRVGFPD